MLIHAHHAGLRGELEQHLTARATRTGGRTGLAVHHDVREFAFSGGVHGLHGALLGAAGQAVTGVLDVCPEEDPARRGSQGGPHTKFTVRRIRLLKSRFRALQQLWVGSNSFTHG